MTPRNGNANVAAPDLHKHKAGVAGVAAAVPLTCAATSGPGFAENTEAATPWGYNHAPGRITRTSCARTRTASDTGAASTRRDGATGSTRDTGAVMTPGTPPGTPPGSRTVLRQRASYFAVAAVPAATHLDVPRTVLLVVAIVAVWVLTLVVRPFGNCWRCRGKRVLINKGRKKARKCWACKGTGRRQRTGSRTVHRVRRTVIAGWQARKENPQ